MEGPEMVGAAFQRNAEGDPKNERLGSGLIRLISKNPKPRQRWRAPAVPPMRVPMSPALRLYFTEFSREARS